MLLLKVGAYWCVCAVVKVEPLDVLDVLQVPLWV